MNDPFKCPDCGVWWRGETHKCSTPSKQIFCPACGKSVAKKSHHTCVLFEDMINMYLPNNKKEHPDDKGRDTHRHS
jgi:hypothetical protein